MTNQAVFEPGWIKTMFKQFKPDFYTDADISIY